MIRRVRLAADCQRARDQHDAAAAHADLHLGGLGKLAHPAQTGLETALHRAEPFTRASRRVPHDVLQFVGETLIRHLILLKDLSIEPAPSILVQWGPNELGYVARL